MKWTTFWFDGNRFCKIVNSLSVWNELREAYKDKTIDEILNAKERTYNGHLFPEERKKRPSYGFRMEHDGEKTLKDFFVENGMEIPVG